MSQGLLHGVRLNLDVERMVRDNFTTVLIRRPSSGVDAQVASFRTRIAQATAAVASRDTRSIPGDAPSLYYVMPVPDATVLEMGDTVWAESARYRVVAVDSLPGGDQAILEGIQ